MEFQHPIVCKNCDKPRCGCAGHTDICRCLDEYYTQLQEEFKDVDLSEIVKFYDKEED